ncbi:MAG TPA: ornithine carbamoyltransferase [Candidatus Krumholzibacteria bacterium]|nr:ornithine carbamoyltransferase [Candidatus Krumholzibacteria bacterium]HPD71583.1 ornithine carbamoyltransferase [Candidatus Krumholzibacteria bacterium]HRY41484.1 ornithine carbamoyltransferase [Candidatus Krumholzibacteria bacterium]
MPGKKDFLRIDHFTLNELRDILDLARRQKPLARAHRLPHTHPNRQLACVFAKPSLRTRVSFEVAIRQLGGGSLFITDKEIGLGTRESIKDVAQVLSRLVDGIMIRWFDQREVDELAAHATVPVINGLTDLLHPCQVMADIMTIEEHLGTINGKSVVMVGDGNNLANSWLNAACVFPFKFTLACPEGYDPDPEIVAHADRAGAVFEITHDPVAAVAGAHVIYSDSFYSMGQEAEAAQRRLAFAPFRLTTALLAGADPGHIVLHCLPAHRGEEITDEVMDGPHSVVYDEAENRLHVQRAILAAFLR